MAKKSSGSLVGVLLLLVPVAWVCNLCTGDHRRTPTAAPARAVDEPEPEPLTARPLPAEPPGAAEPEPGSSPRRRHGSRRAHDEPAEKTETAKAPRAARTVDPFATPDAAGDEAEIDPAELDRALDEVLDSPRSSSRSRPAPSAPAAVPSSTCCKHCGPSSKPCGNSCISLSKTCHKGQGCAC
ncbi:MAG: hypothetical protein H6712_03715 [Myxococcales bacterium]|nr:hypothetical protein [Myxococcales bacterium]